MTRVLLVAGHLIPDAVAALRDSRFASSTSGEQAIWKMGYGDALDGLDERRMIHERWRPVYVAGHKAAINQTCGADCVTDVEII